MTRGDHQIPPGNLGLTTAVMWCIYTLYGCAAPAPVLSPDLERYVREHVKVLIATDFKDLGTLTIEYGAVTEATDVIFFETYVKASTAWRRPRHRTYQLFANTRLFENHPDDQAVRSILAHELLHIRDYLGQSIWQLIKLKEEYKDLEFRREYERSIDLKTLELGYARGLMRYRTWLYGIIDDPEKVEEKQRIYMTPKEIASWLANQ